MSADSDAENDDAEPPGGKLEPTLAARPVIEASPEQAALGEDAEGKRKKGDAKPSYKPTPFDRDLAQTDRTIKWFTVVSGLSAAVSAIAAIYTAGQLASSSRQVDNAISNIAAAAGAAQREASALGSEDNIMAGEFVEMRDQTNSLGTQAKAAQGQLVAAKAQTAAISQQTTAIKATSDANIQAAKAQKRMADVTAQAQRPDVDILSLELTGLSNPPDADGRAQFYLMWRFHNTGGSAFTVKKVEYGLIFGDRLPDQMPPPQSVVNGADLMVTASITSGFSLTQPQPLTVPVAVAKSAVEGKSSVFFYAVFSYIDNLGGDHRKCFGRRFQIIGTMSFAPAGGPAYHCNT